MGFHWKILEIVSITRSFKVNHCYPHWNTFLTASDERRLPARCLLCTVAINKTKVKWSQNIPWYLTKKASSGINFTMFQSGIQSGIKQLKHCTFERFEPGVLSFNWNTRMSHRRGVKYRSIPGDHPPIRFFAIWWLAAIHCAAISVDQCTLKLPDDS